MLDIYTDGSALGNPGPGGWGYIVVQDNKHMHHGSGGVDDTTNNRMELQAVICALQWLLDHAGIFYTRQNRGGVGLFAAPVSEPGTSKMHTGDVYTNPVTIFTDSNYVKLGMTERIDTWIKRDRRLSKGGKMVKNADLWQDLYVLAQMFTDLEWTWVKAHAGNNRNEQVDDLARNAAGNYLK